MEGILKLKLLDQKNNINKDKNKKEDSLHHDDMQKVFDKMYDDMEKEFANDYSCDNTMYRKKNNNNKQIYEKEVKKLNHANYVASWLSPFINNMYVNKEFGKNKNVHPDQALQPFDKDHEEQHEPLKENQQKEYEIFPKSYGKQFSEPFSQPFEEEKSKEESTIFYENQTHEDSYDRKSIFQRRQDYSTEEIHQPQHHYDHVHDYDQPQPQHHQKSQYQQQPQFKPQQPQYQPQPQYQHQTYQRQRQPQPQPQHQNYQPQTYQTPGFKSQYGENVLYGKEEPYYRVKQQQQYIQPVQESHSRYNNNVQQQIYKQDVYILPKQPYNGSVQKYSNNQQYSSQQYPRQAYRKPHKQQKYNLRPQKFNNYVPKHKNYSKPQNKYKLKPPSQKKFKLKPKGKNKQNRQSFKSKQKVYNSIPHKKSKHDKHHLRFFYSKKRHKYKKIDGKVYIIIPGEKPIEIITDYLGRVVSLSMDQDGSRQMQYIITNATPSERDKIFDEIFPKAFLLMSHVFGNYVVQKFFKYGTDYQINLLADLFTGKVLFLSTQTYGCRVIQKALKRIGEHHKKVIRNELNGNVLRCVSDKNGNHVIQKCIETMRQEDLEFILREFRGNIYQQSTHIYSCRVIQRLMDAATEHDRFNFIDEVKDKALELSLDKYGNYVIQHIIRHIGSDFIIPQFNRRFVKLSLNKYSSPVVEICYKFMEDRDREIVLNEMLRLNEKSFMNLMNDQFGNFVIQKIISTSNNRHRDKLLDVIKTHAENAMGLAYSKHIIEKLNSGEFFKKRIKKVYRNYKLAYQKYKIFKKNKNIELFKKGLYSM